METEGPKTCESSLLKISREQGLSISDKRFAQFLDGRDPLKWLRPQIHIPKVSEITENDSDCEGICSYMVTY